MPKNSAVAGEYSDASSLSACGIEDSFITDSKHTFNLMSNVILHSKRVPHRSSSTLCVSGIMIGKEVS